MLALLVKALMPPTSRERNTALGAGLGVQAGVAVLRITRDPVLAAAAAAGCAAIGAYAGACRDLDALDEELAYLRSQYPE